MRQPLMICCISFLGGLVYFLFIWAIWLAKLSWGIMLTLWRSIATWHKGLFYSIHTKELYRFNLIAISCPYFWMTVGIFYFLTLVSWWKIFEALMSTLSVFFGHSVLSNSFSAASLFSIILVMFHYVPASSNWLNLHFKHSQINIFESYFEPA